VQECLGLAQFASELELEFEFELEVEKSRLGRGSVLAGRPQFKK